MERRRADGNHGNAVGRGRSLARRPDARWICQPRFDSRLDTVGAVGSSVGTAARVDVRAARSTAPSAILSVVARWINNGGRGSRPLSTLLHAGHAAGTPQLVVAAQSACLSAVRVRTLGGSDRRTVFALVASLLARPADCV